MLQHLCPPSLSLQVWIVQAPVCVCVCDMSDTCDPFCHPPDGRTHLKIDKSCLVPEVTFIQVSFTEAGRGGGQGGKRGGKEQGKQRETGVESHVIVHQLLVLLQYV